MQQTISKSLFPNHNQIFFNHFNRSTENVNSMAALLYEAIHSPGADQEQKPQYAQISRLRIVSNEIKREVFTDSGKAFISPFERNDMCDLVTAIDNVAGYINISARRISLYQPEEITPPIKELAGLIVELGEHLENCVNCLSNLKAVDQITELCNQIKTLEHYADKVYNNAVANILISEPNAIELIKHNEILTALETTTDKVEKVTSVIEAIIVKNS